MPTCDICGDKIETNDMFTIQPKNIVEATDRGYVPERIPAERREECGTSNVPVDLYWKNLVVKYSKETWGVCDQCLQDLIPRQKNQEEALKMTASAYGSKLARSLQQGLDPSDPKQKHFAEELIVDQMNQNLQLDPSDTSQNAPSKGAEQIPCKECGSLIYLATAKTNEGLCWKCVNSKPKEGCFVATACFGNYYAPEVIKLRRFRDSVIQQNSFGRLFVRLYYACSPSVADFIGRSVFLRRATRVLLLRPLVWLGETTVSGK